MKWAVGSFLLFILFITHALVGAVELGTDGWIQNITGNILNSEQGKILFVFTSLVMFVLRFCAHFIEKKLGLSPIALLFVCAVLACIGLNLASGIETFAGALVALGIYAVGKTFFWPTMLAVASDRYPRTGAVAISIMGGIGMLSAGLIGGPGLGYSKDRFAAESLKTADESLYEENMNSVESSFLFFAPTNAIDAGATTTIQGKLNSARKILEKGMVEPLDETKLKDKDAAEVEKAKAAHKDQKAIEKQLVDAKVLTIGTKGKVEDALKILSDKEKKIHNASIEGDRMTLKADSFIPGTMAVIYLLILIYFRSQGGYKPVKIED